MIDKLWDQERIRRRPARLKIALPFALSILATWLAVVPWSLVGAHSPFLLLFLAVFLSASYGGWRSALLCTIASTTGAICFIFPQHGYHPSFYCAIMFFLLEGLMLTCLFELVENIYDRLYYSEARFRGMIEKSPEGFLLTNADGTIKYAAPGAADILGYSIDELKKRPLTTMVHPDEQRSFDLHWMRLTESFGSKASFMQRLKTSEDNWLWVEGTVTNLLKDPKIQALVFHYRDITERMQKERQQEDFVHMASHELKTPITALKGFTQLIRLNHRKEGRDKDRPMLDRIELQLNKMLGLIDDMLDMTRIKTGELNYHFVSFDLQQCISDVVEAVQPTTPKHHLAFTHEPVPAIYGDRDKIGQVINNLINNAIKYSPDSDSVEIKLEADGDSVRVKVKDHGIGIPKAKQKKVFDRFYRVDGDSKTRFQGLGLGLYISMEIIKRHQGKLGLESEDGQGSEFWFSLPIKPTA